MVSGSLIGVKSVTSGYRSATRREELLLSESALNRMYILRKVLAPLNPVDSMEFLLEKVKISDTNEEFLASMNS